jgi:hypothetical protein
MDPGPSSNVAVGNILTPNDRLLTLKTSVGDPWHFRKDADTTLDPTSFFSEFKDAKKNFFFHVFSYNLSALSSVLKIYFFVKI